MEKSMAVKVDEEVWRQWKIICIQRGWMLKESVGMLIRNEIKRMQGGKA